MLAVVDGDDRALVRAFLDRRTEEAFHGLYQRHSPVLFGLAVRLIGAAEAEDVVQESWLRAISGLPRFAWSSALRTWLCGIVVNCCRERWRVSMDEIADRDPAFVTAPEQAVDLEAALARLPTGYRAAVVLYDIFGYTHPQIAGLLGCEVGTSKSQLARGRRALRELLGAYRNGERT